MAQKINKIILLDADVVIHFIKGGQLLVLPTIFPNDLYMLDVVFDELKKRRSLRKYYENLFSFGLIKSISFGSDIRIIQEYARLKKRFGHGESACMAYCKFKPNILASSNVRDIKAYCEENNIEYLTTLDFILEAKNKEILSEADCDYFIDQIFLKGSFLSHRTIQDYIDFKDGL